MTVSSSGQQKYKMEKTLVLMEVLPKKIKLYSTQFKTIGKAL